MFALPTEGPSINPKDSDWAKSPVAAVQTWGVSATSCRVRRLKTKTDSTATSKMKGPVCASVPDDWVLRKRCAWKRDACGASARHMLVSQGVRPVHHICLPMTDCEVTVRVVSVVLGGGSYLTFSARSNQFIIYSRFSPLSTSKKTRNDLILTIYRHAP